MNRNQKLLYMLCVTLIAALTGCGGGDNPQTMSNPIDPGQDADQPDQDTTDAGQDGDNTDANCIKSLGGSCDPDGSVDPCTNFICICGKWSDGNQPFDNSPCVDPDAGTDAPEDVIAPDVVTPEEVCGNGLDDDGNGKADCQDNACSAEVECQDEICDGQDNNGNSQIDEGFECAQGTPVASCQTTCGSFGTMQCNNDCTWSNDCVAPAENCGVAGDEDCDGKSNCDDTDCSSEPQCQCESPTMGTSCNSGPDTYVPGQYHNCDPNYRCDCSFSWANPATGTFNCAVTEVCNGHDDNNSGFADDGPGMNCIKDTVDVCTTTCGTLGSKSCGDTCTWSACSAPVENCSNGIDDDCDGNTDCEQGICSGLTACQDEICDGQDNNGNSQIDESFACVQNSTNSCTTSCGSQGTSQCSATCTAGACIAFENCLSGGDEDCDGKSNCDDTDCQALPECQVIDCTNNCSDPQCVNAVECHDFGTCAQQGPSGSGYECGTWSSDSVPSSIFQIKSGCANSEYDQWAIGGTWSDVKALHLTGNHTWSEVSLPVTGHAGAMEIMCLSQDRVYLGYNNDVGGVVLHWDGSSFIRLMQNELNGLVIMGLWGTGTNKLWFTGFEKVGTGYPEAFLYNWDGNSLTRHNLPSFGSKVFRGSKFYGDEDNLYLAGMEFDPNDYGNPTTHNSMLLHWDGSSLAKVPGSEDLKEFYGLHGSSTCDVIAVGTKHVSGSNVGASIQRNGDQWVTTTFEGANLSAVASVVKVSPFRYVLQGNEEIGSIARVWMGTPSGASVDWSDISEDFYYPGATWSIPGTSPQVIVTAGNGNNGPEIRRSTCQ